MALTYPPGPQATRLSNASWPHGLEHGVESGQQFIHPSGDDDNDGYTWGTAKATVTAAYDALPSGGGALHIWNGSFIGGTGAAAGKGLWIVGPADPNWLSPPSGFRQQKAGAVGFYGHGGTESDAFGPQAYVGNSDATGPYFWLAGTNVQHYFKDLRLKYPWTSFRIGIASDLSSFETGASSIVLDHVAANAAQDPAAGPNVWLGYTFWLWFFRSGFSSNQAATTQAGEILDVDDRKAGILSRAGTLNGGFVYEHSVVGGGWMRLHTGSGAFGGYSWRIREVLFEGPPAPYPYAPIHIVGAHNYAGNSYFADIDIADSSTPNGCVYIEMKEGHDPRIVAQRNVCINVSSVKGPATLINSGTVEAEERVFQRGIVDDRWQMNDDAGRAQFAPFSVKRANLAAQDSAEWGSASPLGDFTTGHAAPDGTTNAVEFGGTNGFRTVHSANLTLAVGDALMGGVWVRSVNGTVGWDGRLPYWVQLQTAGFRFPADFDKAPSSFRPNVGKGWEWVTFQGEVATIGTNPCLVIVVLGGGSTAPMQYYAPVFIHIPVGPTDHELAQMKREMSGWSDKAPQGAMATLRGQKFIARGGLGVGNSASASTPGTVTKKMEVFDQTGASLGFVPIYDAIT